MEIDYKIVEERINEQGDITYQKVRFYSGVTSTEDEFVGGETDAVVPVTRYRRTEMIEEVEYTYGN